MENTITESLLQKLQWPNLIQFFAGYCQTEEGKEKMEALLPNLKLEEINELWSQVVPLKELVNLGYRVPIGEMPIVGPIFKAARLGQILEGEQFRDLLVLMQSTKQVKAFSNDFKDRCSTLEPFNSQLYPLPKLLNAIEKAISTDGKILDDASKELSSLRSQIRSLNTRIQDKLKKVLLNQDVQTYLQDDFFTQRNDRFVIPIRLDGRGRIKGSIVDTSSSGQTLFIEPPEISSLNDQLKELELAEKLEIIRILRDLSAFVAREVDILEVNHSMLIQLDGLSARAQGAFELKANAITLTEKPCFKLKKAHHPLLFLEDQSKSIPNDIELEDNQNSLIISGPNAGGKTVVLKTVGIIHLMVKAGFLPPVDESSKLHIFKNFYLEMGDSQNLSASLSTFSGHLMGLLPIVNNAESDSIVLMDEIAVGTEPNTGSSIAQAILEHLSEKGAFAVVTTHYDSLKGLAVRDKRFRNGSMEYALDSFSPTYRLILDLPGQSFGIELAKNLGFPDQLLGRASELRGKNSNSMDQVLSELAELKSTVLNEKDNLFSLKMEAETAKARWQHETELLQQTRQKTANKLARKYEQEFEEHQEKIEKATRNLNKEIKKAVKKDTSQVNKAKHNAKESQKGFAGSLDKLRKEGLKPTQLPGKPAKFEELKMGERVFVIPLGKDGTISKLGSTEEEPIEVAVGILKVRSNTGELRIYGKKGKQNPAPKKTKKNPTGSSNQKSDSIETNSFVLQTATNSLNLRGLDIDTAIDKTWLFLDSALMRGEHACVLIHGHGTAALKNSIRNRLASNCPYEVSFRPGMREEGGDGVTIVFLRV